MKNREIKFRAWVSSESQMYYTGFYIHQLTGKCFYEYDGDFKCDYKDQLTPPMYDCGEEEPILMQYTGLKDKNGKEIYEGDILNHKLRSIIQEDKFEEPEVIELEEINICKYEKGSFIFESKNGNSKVIGWVEEFEVTTEEEYCTFEVIGNIYENPELL